MTHPPSLRNRDVAIIGMAGRFPGAGSVEEFWENLRRGVESVSFLSAADLQSSGLEPAAWKDPHYVNAAAFLAGVDLFDAPFFEMSVREAELTDPQHRLFLECAWEALENAGYSSDDPNGAAIGVYAGAAMNSYLISNLISNRAFLRSVNIYQLMVANEKDYLSTRVSYKLNLRGPSVTLQTACSTSLVAVHFASQGLLNGECEMALAGGVSVRVPQKAGYVYEPGGICSADGHTRAFDAKAQGTLFGSGVGIVVLKPLEAALADGDCIRAVVKGSAINNDGASKLGYTAPSAEGQAAVIAKALDAAGVEPETLSYLEAHGTATALGDPVELDALTRVFGARTHKKGFCAVGTAKTNVGHLDAAAGITGLIKTVLSLERREIPPSLHFERPNPAIDFANSPFYVNTALSEWNGGGGPRRAGVNSLGFGGTNAHVVLEEAPPADSSKESRPWQLLLLSAKTESALEAATANLIHYLKRHPDVGLPDVAYTLHVGRRSFRHRRALVCRSAEDALQALESRDPRRVLTAACLSSHPPVVFMFPGHGSEHVNMARELYESEPAFRKAMDDCAGNLQSRVGFDLLAVLYPASGREAEAEERLRQSLGIQLALFSGGYALAALWKSWGIHPDAMVGYSIGEYVSACLAGVFSLGDALDLVAARAELMQSLPEGSMLAVPLPEQELASFLGEGLTIAAFSAPSHCVVAGPQDRTEALRDRLTARGVQCRLLPVTRAFHSEMLDPVLDKYREAVRKADLKPARMRFVSTVTGTWIRPEEPADPEYWIRELRHAVRFSEAISELSKDANRIFLEVGPSHSLSSLVRGHADVSPEQLVLASCRHPQSPQSDVEVLLTAVGKLWLAGVSIDSEGFYAEQRLRRLPLPTYPFERQRYWIDAERESPESPSVAEPGPAPGAGASKRLALVDWQPSRPSPPRRPRPRLSTEYVSPANPVETRIAEIWQELLGINEVGLYDSFFELGGNSLVAVQVMSRVREGLQAEVPLGSFLRAPTVKDLAACVVRESALEAGRPERTRNLEEIEDIAPAAVRISSPAPGAVFCARLPEPSAPGSGSAPKQMRFSLFFFSGDESAFRREKYQLVLEGAKFADRHGFAAVWTPERHFHKFGGLYPNPSVLGAAIAMVTERVAIRAGSVVVPLHHPVRIAEEWAVVDNLSGGRVGIAFAAGFHPNDFVFSPDSFPGRRQAMFRGIETVRQLWRGEVITVPGGAGKEIAVEIFPKPVQASLPVWLATGGNPQTFVEAGEIGANVLTALLFLSVDELAARITLYRETLAKHGHDPGRGEVTLMLHTFLGEDEESARETVREPFYSYLRSHFELIKPMAEAEGIRLDRGSLSAADEQALLAFAFDRYFDTSSLCGTEETCRRLIDRLEAIGVDEVACLIDFGVGVEPVLASLERLVRLRERAAAEESAAAHA